jgi:uncharacterized protein YbjT (DUF2867 family)
MDGTMSETFVVTGATGNVGGELVRLLRTSGRRVRVAVSDVGGARDRFGDDVECVRFRFEDPATFAPALADAAAVFLIRPPPVSAIGRTMGPALDWLDEHGRPHVVVLSVMGAGLNPILPHSRLEWRVRRSGLPFTFLRPSFFMQNLSTTYREEIRDLGVLHVPAGDGRTSFVDVRDVAEVAAHVMGREEHFGAAYTLTGSEALGYAGVAALLTGELGSEVRYTRPRPRAYRRGLIAGGTPAALARVLTGIYFVARHGLADRVTSDTERLLGRPPRRMAEFVRDYRSVWIAAEAAVS